MNYNNITAIALELDNNLNICTPTYEKASLNLDTDKEEIKDLLGNEKIAKVGCNLKELACELGAYGIQLKGSLYDIAIAEALFNKEPSTKVKLENSFSIFKNYYKKLDEFGLKKLYTLETDLIPIIQKMEERGVKIDVAEAETKEAEIIKAMDLLYDDIYNATGIYVDIWKNDSIANIFDILRLKVERTEKGRASFSTEKLEAMVHSIPHKIVKLRKLDKLLNTFLKQILRTQQDGILRTHYNILKGDNGGTATGRFSSYNPCLQNIPSELRNLFIPFDDEKWVKYDYSQMEYRLLLHFGYNDKAKEQVKEKDFNIHNLTKTLFKEAGNTNIDYKTAKSINYGLLYGMSASTLAKTIKQPDLYAESLMAIHRAVCPFLYQATEEIKREASVQGYITTILNRRFEFPYFYSTADRSRKRMSFAECNELYKPSTIKRADVYKAVNYKLQGSNADILKLAMVQLEKEGFYKKVGYPTITLHDELDFSTNADMKTLNEVKQILENTIPLSVPIVADLEIGDNWQKVKAIN